MIHKMFVIYDSKANAYMQPWFLTQEAMAQRAFGDCVNDKEHNFGMHPEDYTLFAIGEFNDQSAKVDWTTPISFGNGIQYVLTPKTDEQIDFIQEGIEQGHGIPSDLDGQNQQILDKLSDKLKDLT